MQREYNTNGSGEMSEEGDEWMKSMCICVLEREREKKRAYVFARAGERKRERSVRVCMCKEGDAECLAAVDRQNGAA